MPSILQLCNNMKVTIKCLELYNIRILCYDQVHDVILSYVFVSNYNLDSDVCDPFRIKQGIAFTIIY